MYDSTLHVKGSCSKFMTLYNIICLSILLFSIHLVLLLMDQNNYVYSLKPILLYHLDNVN